MGVIHQWGDDGTGGDAAVALEPVLISGAPDYDPGGPTNPAYASLVDNGGGSYTFGLNNVVAVNGAGEGAIWVADMPSGWVDDGSKIVTAELTIEADAPDSVDLWVAIGICDLGGDASNAGSDPLVAGVLRQSTANLLMVMSRTATIIRSGSGGTNTVEVTIVPGGVYSGLECIGTITAVSVDTGLDTSRNGGAAAGSDVKIIVVAGCNDAGGTGPHEVGVLLKAAVLSRPSA